MALILETIRTPQPWAKPARWQFYFAADAVNEERIHKVAVRNNFRSAV
jgi:hypothetical protein